MNGKFQSILKGIPKKPPRSRLEPYYKLIAELRRRGRTYREIERILVDQCQFRVSRSTINDFVRARSGEKTKAPARQMTQPTETTAVRPSFATEEMIKTIIPNQGNPPTGEVYRRIAELKRRPVATQTTPKQFHYDPNEPLRIRTKVGENSSDK
jgi:hypothetical protein